jgi:multicomponent Na+:H+ antiporter subunit D
MPWTAAALVIAGASLIGIPGTAGFISKWLLLQAALQQGPLGVVAAVAVVAGSLAALAYVWRIIEPLYFGTAEGSTAGGSTAVYTATPPLLLLALWLAAGANVYFGLIPAVPVSLSELAAAELLGHLR